MTGPVPARVNTEVKDVLLGLVDHSVGEGWPMAKACEVLVLDVRRAQRWITRRHSHDLPDHRPGASVNALLPDEVTAIVDVFDTWGERDRSHRRLAHRGSYTGAFWASPSTVRRILTLQDKHFHPLPRPAKGHRRPFPAWASYTPNSIWIYDSTHFTRAGMTVGIIEDLVSRKWLTHLVSVEETHTQVENAFTSALQAKGLLEAALQRADTGRVDPDTDDGLSPILLAVSDNSSQMITRDTRKFMALLAIAQHFGRRCTPTDQAWIESLNGTIKGEWPHLLAIDDPAVPARRTRHHPHRVQHRPAPLRHRYLTPDDEHTGRGAAIRAARREGLHTAHQRRLAHHRTHRNKSMNHHPPTSPQRGLITALSATMTLTHLSSSIDRGWSHTTVSRTQIMSPILEFQVNRPVSLGPTVYRFVAQPRQERVPHRTVPFPGKERRWRPVRSEI